MKPLFVILVAIVLAAVLGLTLRNYQLELGARALNDENGELAIRRFKPLAVLGDSKAQYLLGNIYAYGWAGAKKNDSQAIYWFRRAGLFVKDEEDPAAAAELAVAKSYADGTDGVPADRNESTKWLRLAAEGGSREAAQLLEKESPSR